MGKITIKHIIFFFVFISGIQTACAQDIAVRTELHFATNAYELSADHIHSLDSVISSLSNIPQAYRVHITGYTDYTGTDSFNKRLSYKRAYRVADYFESKGFKKTNTVVEGKGSNRQSAFDISENNKAMNRRVDITIVFDVHSPSQIGAVSLKDNRYIFNNRAGGIFQYSSGTSVYVPPSAFVDANGKEVSGDISLQYREYRDPLDFILRGIPMSKEENGELYHFNSGGMFEILAFKNNEQVFIKPGEAVEINFATVQQLPNMNFYRFDTTDHHWNELAKLTGNHNFPIGMDITLSNGIRTCYIDKCASLDLLTYIGTSYAKSTNDSVTRQLSKIDSLRIIRTDWENKAMRDYSAIANIRDSFKEADDHRVFEQPSPGSYHLFNIKITNPQNGEASLFRGLTFKYRSSKNQPLPARLLTTYWREALFTDSLNTGAYTLRFISPDSELSLSGVELIPDQKMRKNERKQFTAHIINQIDSAAEKRTDLIKKANISVRLLEEQTAETEIEIKKLKPLLEEDSLFCFWDKSKHYMDSAENNMSYKDWLNYFDSHKPDMLVRYTKLKSDTLANYCAFLAAQAKRYLEQQRRADSLGKEGDLAATQFFQSLSISQTGIYNCDQIQRLTNPVEVAADYVDMKGKKLEPLIIYILDSKINGMLKYDGHYGFGPYRFAFSPSSRTSMIAIDESGKKYIFSSGSFNEIKPASNIIRYTFRLTEIKSTFTKEQLIQLL